MELPLILLHRLRVFLLSSNLSLISNSVASDHMPWIQSVFSSYTGCTGCNRIRNILVLWPQLQYRCYPSLSLFTSQISVPCSWLSNQYFYLQLVLENLWIVAWYYITIVVMIVNILDNVQRRMGNSFKLQD